MVFFPPFIQLLDLPEWVKVMPQWHHTICTIVIYTELFCTAQKSHKNLAIKLLGSPYILFNVYNVFKEATVIQVPDSGSSGSSSKTNFCAWVFLKHCVSRLQPAKCCFIKNDGFGTHHAKGLLFSKRGNVLICWQKPTFIFCKWDLGKNHHHKHFVHCMPLPWKRHCEEEKLLFLEIVLC